ncbi:hypothetical protein HanPI659440_Chr03g0101251 [Helianthus annuus]|nr:hypothetical protein HanPI659440_Chr03g0101251 [Helianthus annuus]
MMEDKFGRKKINIFGDSTETHSDDDGDDEGGDGGDTGASAAGTAGASSAGGDEEDTESDDNQPEPGYEFYLDECDVKKVRNIRQEDDDTDYVPSDTEAERLKRKQTVTRRKKKARKYIGASSVQQSVPQQEPIQEADMNPNLGFTADEAATFISSPPRSSEPTPIVMSALETPTATPQEPACSIASTIRATTSQPTSEHRQSRFSQMQQDEKVYFLFSQLQAAAG